MRLLESFFRAQTFNPYVPPMELIFSKTTAGSFSFTIPANARNIKIEFAGGNGGPAYMWEYATGSGGRGEKVTIFGNTIGDLAGKVISGYVGATATSSTGGGGAGDPAGGNGTHSTPGGSSSYGGGGGGATRVEIDGTTYRASGGGGATFNDYYGGWYHSVGGAGGGPKGGAAGSAINDRVVTNGKNATGDDINETNYGYIRIYINAQEDVLYDKRTTGAFSYTIPNTVSVAIIEIAAGNGADGGGGGYAPSSGNAWRYGGKGAVKVITVSNANGKTISGLIGQTGGATGITTQGGTPDGSNGQTKSSSEPLAFSYGGGGGGSSYCVVDGITYTVSGGAGGAAHNANTSWAQGGAGGGPNAGQPVTNGNGGDATDGDRLNTESIGYIKIYKA
jgi:hypothetical protein